jgi:Uma2 family endonuclease
MRRRFSSPKSQSPCDSVCVADAEPGNRRTYPGAPDIAIDSVSSETAAHLQNKIDLYLEHGRTAVWVFYSRPPRILMHGASGLATKLHGNQILDDADVLPGFSAPISAIFGGL